jgi:hypothetical protein
MTPAQRCDEIIRMIDEVLDADTSDELGPLGSRSHQAMVDPRSASAGAETLR